MDLEAHTGNKYSKVSSNDCVVALLTDINTNLQSIKQILILFIFVSFALRLFFMF